MKNLMKFMSCLVVMVVLSLSAFAATGEVSQSLSNINKNLNAVNKSDKDLQKNLKDLMADFKQNKLQSLTLACAKKSNNSDWVSCLASIFALLEAFDELKANCVDKFTTGGCLGAIYPFIEAAQAFINECGPLVASNNPKDRKLGEEIIRDLREIQTYLTGFKYGLSQQSAS